MCRSGHLSLWSSVPFGSCVARPVRYSLFKELKFLYKSTGSAAPSGHVTVGGSGGISRRSTSGPATICQPGRVVPTKQKYERCP